MKKGDKVRFLSETGGGIIAGFKNNNIVLVEDADGFQIPVSITEVVVVNDEQDKKQGRTSIGQPVSQANTPKQTSIGNQSVKALLSEGYEEQHLTEEEPIDREITFRKPVEERLGGNNLNLYLGYIPNNIKELSTTKFDIYLVNDSNYYINYTYTTTEEQSSHLRSCGEVEPNTKVFLEEITHKDLNTIEHTTIQAIAYKKQKDYAHKPPIDVQLHIEPLKFRKQHLFTDNSFFEAHALLYPIIEDDKVADNKLPNIDPDTIKYKMLEQSANRHSPQQTSNQPVKGKDILGYKATDHTLVVDLHTDEILDTTQGMDALDILQYQLDYFRRTLDQHAKEKGLKVIFIHGKGEGVLRKAIINALHRHYKGYLYQDASFREYGYGATQVTIK